MGTPTDKSGGKASRITSVRLIWVHVPSRLDVWVYGRLGYISAFSFYYGHQLG